MHRVNTFILYVVLIAVIIVVAHLWQLTARDQGALISERLLPLRGELKELRDELKELGYKSLQQQSVIERLKADLTLQTAQSAAPISTAVEPTASLPIASPPSASPPRPSGDDAAEEAIASSGPSPNVAASLAAGAPFASSTRTPQTQLPAQSAKPAVNVDASVPAAPVRAAATPLPPVPPASPRDIATMAEQAVETARAMAELSPDAPADTRKTFVFSSSVDGTQLREDVSDTLPSAPTASTVDAVLSTMDIADLVSTMAAPASATATDAAMTPVNAEELKKINASTVPARPATPGLDPTLPGATPTPHSRLTSRLMGADNVIDMSSVGSTAITVRITTNVVADVPRRATIEITAEDVVLPADAAALTEPLAPLAPAVVHQNDDVITAYTTTPPPARVIMTPPTRVTTVPSVSAEPAVEADPVRLSRRAREAEQERARLGVTLNLTDQIITGTGAGPRRATMSDVLDAYEQQPAATPSPPASPNTSR